MFMNWIGYHYLRSFNIVMTSWGIYYFIKVLYVMYILYLFFKNLLSTYFVVLLLVLCLFIL